MNVKFDLLKLGVRFFNFILMDIELTKYVEKIEDKLIDKNNLNIIYYKDGNKLKKLFSDNSHKKIIAKVEDYIQTYDHESGYAYVMISFGAQLRSFRYGPITLICTLLTIGKNNKLDMSRSTVGVVRYTIEELKTRGYKTNDYKKLYNKVRKGHLTNAKKIYNASNLDKI